MKNKGRKTICWLLTLVLLFGLTIGTAAPAYAGIDLVFTPEDPSLSDSVPGGETPDGETPDGETPDGETPDGETPDGETPDGETPDGETPGGETPDGETPDGETPDGETPDGETPDGETPDGETPDEEDPDEEDPDEEDPDEEDPDEEDPDEEDPDEEDPDEEDEDEEDPDPDDPANWPAFTPAPVTLYELGVTVTLEADAGVFPADAELSVTLVPQHIQQQVDEAVEDERAAEQTVAVSYTFDICVLDADGSELQPTDGAKVRVSFSLAEAADENLETQVYHVTEDDASGELSAEKLDIVEQEGETVTAETEGFSIYTVEFTYQKKQYVLPGGESVPLADVLTAVGLQGTVQSAESSAPEKFSVYYDSTNGWVVYANKPFATTERLRVTIGGVEYEITVTDENDGPTEIGSADDWDAFAAAVAEGNTYEGQTVRMTANVGPVTTPVGSSAAPFRGTFDGNGYTLTVNISGGGGTAAFGYVKNAAIQNLKVTGTVNTNGFHSAGLIGANSGTTTISNVLLDVAVNGEGVYIGGFIGHGQGDYQDHGQEAASTVTMTNCVFSGKLKGALSGAFVGWCDKLFNLTVENCAFVGTCEGGSFHPLGFGNAPAQVTLTNNGFFFTVPATGNGIGGQTVGTQVVAAATPGVFRDSIQKGTVPTYYGTIPADWSDTLTLLTDVTVASTVGVPAGAHTLDLNGCGIRMTGSNSVINVGSSANLTITDSDSSRAHYITLNDFRGTAVADTGTESDATDGSGVAKVTGGYITGGNPSQGGAVYITGSGVLNMNGGTLIGNKAAGGGAIFISTSSGTSEIKNAKLIYNYASSCGGAIQLLQGNLKLENCDISYNRNADVDGYSAIHAGTDNTIGCTMTNCTITHNSGGAGAVQNWRNNGSGTATMDLTDVTITDNTASDSEGVGVGGFVIKGTKNNVITNFKGNCLITNNTPCNLVIIEQYVTINITGALTNTTPIGVTMQSGAGVFTDSTNTTYNDASKFTSDNAGYSVFKNRDGQLEVGTPPVASVTVGETITDYTVFATALSNWTPGSTLTLYADVTTSTVITFDGRTAGAYTLDLNGFGILATGRRVFEVKNSGAVTLTINDGAADSDSAPVHMIALDSNGKAIGVYETGGTAPDGTAKPVKVTGGYLAGGYDSGNGGGMIIDSRCTVILTGGTIIGNQAGYSGGAVGIFGGTLTMQGGAITGNTAGTNGSGVYVENGTLTVSGSATISGNMKGDAKSNVYLAEGKTITVDGELTCEKPIGVTMANGTGVFTNSANTDYNDASKFTSDAGYAVVANASNQLEIMDVDASVTTAAGATRYYSWAYAVQAWHDAKAGATLTLLRNVTASSQLNAQNGTESAPVTLDLNGYKLTSTVGNANENIISIDSNVYLHLKDTRGGGEIYRDAANANKGIGTIWVSEGHLIMYGGKITDGAGGYGIHTGNGGSFTMYDGEITGLVNKNYAAVQNAAGTSGTITLHGGIIKENKKGVTFDSGTTVNLGGSLKITGNTAGNLCVDSGNTVNIDYALTADASIGVTMGAPGVFAAAGSYNDASKFFSDNSTYAVGKNATTGQLFLGTKCTVTFNTNGHGTAPTSQSVAFGSLATRPDPDPTADGWAFAGWYADAACQNAWSFDDYIVESDVTIYAKWSQLYKVSGSITINDFNGTMTVSLKDSSDTAVGEAETLSAANEWKFSFNGLISGATYCLSFTWTEDGKQATLNHEFIVKPQP